MEEHTGGGASASYGGDFAMPVGFCFNPSMEDIVAHYLFRKIRGELSTFDKATVKEHDIYKEEPWQSWDSSLKSSSTDDLEFVFFYTKWKNVSGKGERKLRMVGSGGGKWHEECKAQTHVLVNGDKMVVLRRKFTYQGSLCPPRSWAMTEFSLKTYPNDYVICKLNRNKRSPPPHPVAPPLPSPSPPVAVKQPTTALNKKRKSSSTSTTATSWSKKRKSFSTSVTATSLSKKTPQEDIVSLPTVDVSGQTDTNDHQENSPSLLIEAEGTDIELGIPWDTKWDTECFSSYGFHDNQFWDDLGPNFWDYVSCFV
ncbi:hypothetical protein Tsubulata_041298 [Turnera subulata]|uniref:NAC domain-containing protein n=1 Tax=Turnera subulata TaxID=218843 RepID=A0A9Q0EXS2_9ROSI|nr:hypothetical protein Tsubulata_041298 [Turnera subulata]